MSEENMSEGPAVDQAKEQPKRRGRPPKAATVDQVDGPEEPTIGYRYIGDSPVFEGWGITAPRGEAFEVGDPKVCAKMDANPYFERV